MDHSRNPQHPSEGTSPSPTGHTLTPQEQAPIIILHVDIDNGVTVSTRYARDSESAKVGAFLGAPVTRFASHILAEATWGTVNSATGEWFPVGVPVTGNF